MKHLLLLISILFTLNLSAQDTIKVSTFNWSSTNRADTFQFPDNPGESYRKILMLYNMRCHDAIVGNGSTGCLEWDYSCNTFITDPTRKDSIRRSHPDYIISNFSGNEFEYTTKPTYTYNQYNQHNTIITGTATQTGVVGGFGKMIALNPGNETAKLQFLYLQSELSDKGLTAGDIQKIQMDVETLGAELGYFRIRLKNTNAATLNPDLPETEGFTEVYFKNTLFDDIGLIDYNFYQAFNWDGVSNVIVEFSYVKSPGGNDIELHGFDSGFNCALASTETDHALYFEGSGSAIVNPAALTTISDEISVSLWAYGSPKFLPANSTIFEGGDDQNRRVINVHLPWSDSRVYWDCGRDEAGNVDRIDKQANASDFEGKWSNWVFTKNATTGDMKIFLNGSLWHSGSGLKRLIDMNSLSFGSAVSWVNNYFGSIDELQIWDVALDEANIKTWLRKSIDNTHPLYNNLKAYYKLNEGSGNVMHSSASTDLAGTLVTPTWQRIKGVDLYRNFKVSTNRPIMFFNKGNYTVTDQIIKVIDSTLNAPNQVVHFGVNGSDLVALDTQYVYSSGYKYVYDETENIVDSVLVSKESSISIANLFHYQKSNSRFELLSLVTPYGINLDLGKTGKTFTFDVTDYAPILKGEKYMSIEFGGQWQEELDIQFLFIKGTPPREIRNIQNIWPQGNGGHGDILNDNIFEPRTITLDPNASYYKVRSAITGHGQNGEFVPQQHFIDINGGTQEFTYDVWKKCAKNPIYPQGGTWIFDRAGWCPGMASDVHEFDITPFASPGSSVTINYGMNAAPMGAANYLVSNQLVSYGEFNHTKDASIETVMKPNNKSVEYERINPACNMPTILVRNTGKTIIQSLDIDYKVQGGVTLSYKWTGTIQPMMSEQIELPVKSTGFWLTNNPIKVFEAQIIRVNGTQDDYAANDVALSSFDLAKQYEFTDPLQIKLKTNVKASENSYTIIDSEGKIVLSRNNMANNTTYIDEIDVAPGCYTFKFEDTGEDGLTFWFFPENGSGSLRLERLFNGSAPILMKNFNPDMGGGVQFDFIRGVITDTKQIDSYTLMSLYPNPAGDQLNIEMHGFLNENLKISIVDLTGRELINKKVLVNSNEFTDILNIASLNPGMYFLKVNNGNKVWVKQLVKE